MNFNAHERASHLFLTQQRVTEPSAAVENVAHHFRQITNKKTEAHIEQQAKVPHQQAIDVLNKMLLQPEAIINSWKENPSLKTISATELTLVQGNTEPRFSLTELKEIFFNKALDGHFFQNTVDRYMLYYARPSSQAAAQMEQFSFTEGVTGLKVHLVPIQQGSEMEYRIVFQIPDAEPTVKLHSGTPASSRHPHSAN